MNDQNFPTSTPPRQHHYRKGNDTERLKRLSSQSLLPEPKQIRCWTGLPCTFEISEEQDLVKLSCVYDGKNEEKGRQLYDIY
jgi:hypothetical protein